MEPIRRAEDTDGCTCLRCRTVDSALRRRSVAGDVLWAVNLFQRSPPVLLVVLLVVGLSFVLWPVAESLPQTWPVETGVAVYIVLSATVLRTYAVSLTTASLQDSTQSARSLFVTSQRHLPAVVVILLAVLGAAGGAILIGSILSWGVVVTVPFVTEQIYDGFSATLLFGSLSALVVFKFWLAPEICIAGNYRPVAALRLSWSVTSLYWVRVLVVIVGFAVTVYLPELGGQAIAAAGGEWLLWSPLTGAVQLVFYSVGYVVWFAVGTQIYLRSVLDQ